MFRSFAPLVIAAVAWLSWPHTADACSCVPPLPPAAARDDADAVFEGRTYGSLSFGQQARYTFEVDRVFKGDVSERIDIRTPTSPAACGRHFEMGVPYLVYARLGSDGNWSDHLCSRTRAVSSAGEDFEVLGAGRPATSGAVERSPDDSMPMEPPRIEPRPQGPPPTRARGCAVEKPHGSASWPWLAVVALGLRPRRRMPASSRRAA